LVSTRITCAPIRLWMEASNGSTIYLTGFSQLVGSEL
jgi:hypothetical protein